jgi:hypothetical protein
LPVAGTDRSEDHGELALTEEETRAFVGPKSGYYFSRWQPVLEGRARGAGFNAAAFLLAGLWLPYRKLYRVAFAFYGIFLAVNLLDLLLAPRLGRGAGSAGARWLLAIIGWFVCGFFANRWYLSRAIRVVSQARSQRLEREAHLQWIRNRGGTSIALSLGMFVAFMGVNLAVLTGAESLSVFGPGLGKKLTFNGGELYYTSNVSQQEAQDLGEYLVRARFFDGKRKTVQLARSGNKVEFRMVVLKGYERNPQFIETARQFSLELSRDVFRDAPVDIHLCDEYMNTLKTVNGR